MKLMRRKLLDGAFACTVAAFIILLDWDWENMKSFISGGVVGVWLTMRFY